MKKRLRFFLGVSAFAALSVADAGCMKDGSSGLPRTSRLVCREQVSCDAVALLCESGISPDVAEDFAQCIGVENVKAASCIPDAFAIASKIRPDDPNGLLVRILEVCGSLKLDDHPVDPYIFGMQMLVVAEKMPQEMDRASVVVDFLDGLLSFGTEHQAEQRRLLEALPLITDTVRCMFARAPTACDVVGEFIGGVCLRLSENISDSRFNPYVFGMQLLQIIAAYTPHMEDPVPVAVAFLERFLEFGAEHEEEHERLIEAAPFVARAIANLVERAEA